MTILVEGCVESLEDSLAAERGGAGRLELCDDLSVGGITPTSALITAVKTRVRIPVAVMIRPRGGSFVHTRAELDQMRRDLEMAKGLGADVLVFGVLNDRREVDTATTRELVARAGETPVTFHRAFDQVANPLAELDALIDAGVCRVLTGGGPGTAEEGADLLASLVERAAGRIGILAGGKVRSGNAAAIVARSGVREVHARCDLDENRIRDIVAVLA
ncbi:MAG: copper homeostasis protein CutC [bacterium]